MPATTGAKGGDVARGHYHQLQALRQPGGTAPDSGLHRSQRTGCVKEANEEEEEEEDLQKSYFI